MTRSQHLLDQRNTRTATEQLRCDRHTLDSIGDGREPLAPMIDKFLLEIRCHEVANAGGHTWQHVRLSQLNAELAVQLHGLALKNDAKHRAVRRLFIGLRAMAFMLGAVLAMYLLFSWT